MSETLKAETVSAESSKARRLWFGLLGPPAVWAIQLQSVYLASEWACYSMDYRWVHVASVAALIISLLALWIAYSQWKLTGGGTSYESADPETRRRFMAIVGMLLGALSVVLIFATWLPTLSGVPCGK